MSGGSWTAQDLRRMLLALDEQTSDAPAPVDSEDVPLPSVLEAAAALEKAEEILDAVAEAAHEMFATATASKSESESLKHVTRLDTAVQEAIEKIHEAVTARDELAKILGKKEDRK